MRGVVSCASLVLAACVAANGDYQPAGAEALGGDEGSSAGSSTSGLNDDAAEGSTEAAIESTDDEGPQPSSTGSDESDDSTTGDTEGAGPWVFEGVEQLEVINALGFDDDDPSLSANGLELYFASTRSGNEDVYVATRETVGDPWSPPMPLPGPVNTMARDSSPELSLDGLSMTISSDRGGGLGNLDLFLVTRPALDQPWGAPVHLTELNDSNVDGSAVLTSDLTRVFFCSIRGVVGNEDVFVAERKSADLPFGEPVRLGGEINSDYFDCNPWIDPTGSLMLFSTSRGGVTDSDLMVVEQEGGSFGAVVSIEGVNTTAREQDPWLSPDGNELYFSRSLPTDETHIFRAVRAP